MRFIDFTKLGGFRLKQSTLDRMQKAYFEILHTLLAHLGVVYENFTIISGCNIDGDYITEGIMFMDGDLCKFERTEGTLNSKITKLIVFENVPFKGGLNQQVYKTTTAKVDTVNGIQLNQFVRIDNFKKLIWSNIGEKPAGLVIDANYVHTDNNFSNGASQKLGGIQENAEVNVQADWNENNIQSDAYIKNKPQGDLLTYLYKNTAVIGDLNGDFIEQITFPTVGTANYMPIITIISNTGPRVFSVFDKTDVGFKIQFKNEGNITENISLNYCLIPL